MFLCMFVYSFVSSVGCYVPSHSGGGMYSYNVGRVLRAVGMDADLVELRRSSFLLLRVIDLPGPSRSTSAAVGCRYVCDVSVRVPFSCVCMMYV